MWCSMLKIHYTLYIFLLISFFCNFFIETIIMFSILFLHELGHIFFLLKYKRKITSITFYPFGGIIKHSGNNNNSIKEDFFINFGGVFINIVLLFIFNFLNLELFSVLNFGILLFNILPIYPLDGSKIVKNIYSYFTSYKYAIYLTLVTSILTIILFIVSNFLYIKSIYVYLLIISLIKMNYDYYKNINSEYKFFITNKYIFPNDNLKIKKVKPNRNPINKLFLGRNTTFVLDNISINEYEILENHFNN